MIEEDIFKDLRDAVVKVYSQYYVPHNTGTTLTLKISLKGIKYFLDWIPINGSHSSIVVRDNQVFEVVKLLRLNFLLKGYDFCYPIIEKTTHKINREKQVAIYFTDSK